MMKTIKSKLVFSLLFFLISLISFNLTSCENIVQKDDGKKIEEEREEEAEEELELPPAPDKGYLRLSVTQKEINNNARTILPEININTLTSFVLTGTKEGVDYTIGSWSSVSAVTAGNLELDLGTWNLTLTAKQDNGKIFTGTASNVQVQLGVVKPVSFVLSATNNQGGISFTLNYVTSTPVTKVKYNLYNFSSSSESEADHGYLTPVSNSVSFIKDSVTSPLNPGTYRLQITFFSDDDENVIIGVYSEIVQIKGGFTSKGTNSVNLNQMWYITYNRDGGTPVGGAGLQETYSIYSGDINFPNLEKTGYNFVGWFKDAACTAGNEITKITEGSSGNIPVYAKFTARNDTAYKVKHIKESISGDYTSIAPDIDDKTGTTDEMTEAVVKDTTNPASTYYGFTAQSWNQDTIAPDGTTVITIKYKRNSYRVTYNGDGNTEGSVPEWMDYKYQETVYVSFPSNFKKTGFNFDGWSDGTNIYTSSGTKTFAMPAANVTLTAQWSAAISNYKVKHLRQNLDDLSVYDEITEDEETLSGITGKQTHAEAKDTTTPGTPYYGFTVVGFAQESIAGDNTTVITIKYNRQSHTVKYAAPDKTGGDLPYDVSYYYGRTVTVNSSRIPTKTGYELEGWTKDGTTLSAGDTFKMGAEDVTLTAKWKVVNYDIEFNLNDGAFANGYTKPSSYNIESPDITLPTASNISRKGYTFGGWYTTSAFSGAAQTKIGSGSSGKKTYYAKWELITYTIEYETYGASWTSGSIYHTNYNITTSTLTLGSLSKDYYTFQGWHEKEDFSDPVVTKIEQGSTGNKKFYAKFGASHFSISYYNLTDATNPASNPTSYTCESEITLEPAEKDGFAFMGWYDNYSFTGEPVTKIEKGSHGGLILWAKFVEKIDISAVLNEIQDAGAGLTVTVTGAMTPDELSQICTKVKARTAGINLDLSGVSGITSIPSNAFYGASLLMSIKLPDSVEEIGTYAFFNTNLEPSTITLPANLKTIGSLAFGNAGKGWGGYGTSVTIPASVTSIGVQAFFNCPIGEFKVASGNTKFNAYKGILYEGDKLISYNYGNNNPHTVEIKAGTKTIGSQSFANAPFDGGTQVILPSSVESIEANAFANIPKDWELSIYEIDSTLTFKSNSFNQNQRGTKILLDKSIDYYKTHIIFETNWNSNCTNDLNQFVFGGFTTQTWTQFLDSF